MKFFLFREKRSQAGFEPRTLTTKPEHTHALDRSAMAPIVWSPIPDYSGVQMVQTSSGIEWSYFGMQFENWTI